MESSASSNGSQERVGEPQVEKDPIPWIPWSPEELPLFQGPGNVGSQIPCLQSHPPLTAGASPAPQAGANLGIPCLAIPTGMSFVMVNKGHGMSLDLLGLGWVEVTLLSASTPFLLIPTQIPQNPFYPTNPTLNITHGLGGGA